MNQPDHAPSAPASLDVRRRRILYRATHRGTQEADLLVGGFVTPRLARMTDADLDELEALLELPDVDLADWLSGRRPVPDDRNSPMLRRMKDAAAS